MDGSSSVASPALIDVTPEDLHRWLLEGSACPIDIREPAEFVEGHLPAAISQPMAQLTPAALRSHAGRVVLYCRSGRRTAIAAQQLFEQGLNQDILHLQGGILAWKEAGHNTLEIET